MDALVVGFVVGLALWATVFGWVGGWVAYQCGRKSSEGWLLGGLLGPFGVIVVGLLPKYPDDPHWHTRR